jgi:hypothetical protein
MQGLLNSIAGPGESSALGPSPTQPKCKWSIRLNIYLLHRYFKNNQCLNIKKNMPYTTYKHYHGVPMLVEPPATAQCAQALRWHSIYAANICYIDHLIR